VGWKQKELKREMKKKFYIIPEFFPVEIHPAERIAVQLTYPSELYYCFDLLFSSIIVTDSRREFYLYNPVIAYKEELELLQSILHFPEEVALRLSEVEYALFYSVPPVDYIRHMTTNLSVADENKETLNYTDLFYNVDISGYCTLRNGQTSDTMKASVHDLVKRFNEVGQTLIREKFLTCNFL